MNKILFKICCMCTVLGITAFSAHGDDLAAQGVAVRTDCATVRADIARLGAIEEPSADEEAELATLQSTYRRDCAPRANGRGATVRAARGVAAKSTQTTATAAVTVAAPTDALGKYLAAKKENCDMLNSAMVELKKDAVANADMLKYMQTQYDADCNKVETESTVTDAGDAEPVAPTDTRTEAEIVADNLAAGLCADGTEPNKFGCCTDETFRDMGNAVFACCPKQGGDCFPPMPVKGE